MARAGACEGHLDIPASGRWGPGNCGEGALLVLLQLSVGERENREGVLVGVGPLVRLVYRQVVGDSKVQPEGGRSMARSRDISGLVMMSIGRAVKSKEVVRGVKEVGRLALGRALLACFLLVTKARD